MIYESIGNSICSHPLHMNLYIQHSNFTYNTQIYVQHKHHPQHTKAVDPIVIKVVTRQPVQMQDPAIFEVVIVKSLNNNTNTSVI